MLNRQMLKTAEPETIGWKAVMFIWAAALPFLVGAGFVTYQRYPGPFQGVVKFSKREFAVGQKAYFAYKVDQQKAADAAAKKAKDEAQATDDQQF